jgi:DNA-directed RNA polymerase subunit RPC12/RpoP
VYPEIYKLHKNYHHERWKKNGFEEVFQCLHCDAQVVSHPMISGVQNRNHCPYCLHSRHVDHVKAGDRMSACKAIMQPIGLTVKPGRNKYAGMAFGELMLVHRCSSCGKLSINRLAADDQVEMLLEIYYESRRLELSTLKQVTLEGIRILQGEDWKLVAEQLHGTKLR